MDEISQKQINEICRILRDKPLIEGSKELADVLEKANIIPAMYVLTYLQCVNSLREKTQVLDTSSDFAKKYKQKRNDFDEFKKKLDRAYHLELHYLIDTPEKFEGAMWLLYQALDRKDKICDFDDSKAAPKKFGRCENEDHYENIEHEPIVPLTKEEQKAFDKECEKENWIFVAEKYPDNFNPKTDLTVVHGWDEDSSKLIQNEVWYTCSRCTKAMQDQDGGYPACDLDLME